MAASIADNLEPKKRNYETTKLRNWKPRLLRPSLRSGLATTSSLFCHCEEPWATKQSGKRGKNEIARLKTEIADTNDEIAKLRKWKPGTTDYTRFIQIQTTSLWLNPNQDNNLVEISDNLWLQGSRHKTRNHEIDTDWNPFSWLNPNQKRIWWEFVIICGCGIHLSTPIPGFRRCRVGRWDFRRWGDGARAEPVAESYEALRSEVGKLAKAKTGNFVVSCLVLTECCVNIE